MTTHCIACKAAVADSPAERTSSRVCPCYELSQLYDGDNDLVSCAGGCGRSELIPAFLQVGTYVCTECTMLLLELSRERNSAHE